jgi:hypothetical protein
MAVAEPDGPAAWRDEEPTAAVVTDSRTAAAAITRTKCLRIADLLSELENGVSKL